MEFATLILIGLCFENVVNWSLHAYHLFDCKRNIEAEE